MSKPMATVAELLRIDVATRLIQQSKRNLALASHANRRPYPFAILAFFLGCIPKPPPLICPPGQSHQAHSTIWLPTGKIPPVQGGMLMVLHVCPIQQPSDLVGNSKSSLQLLYHTTAEGSFRPLLGTKTMERVGYKDGYTKERLVQDST
jgi:hypothetical protein